MSADVLQSNRGHESTIPSLLALRTLLFQLLQEAGTSEIAVNSLFGIPSFPSLSSTCDQ
jgi:hypothetical protein